MAEREFPGFTLRSSATKDGARFKALLSSHPVKGFPSYFTVYDNRSFRDEESASAAAEKALGLVLGVEDDGAPIFAEGETGFDDDKFGDDVPDDADDADDSDDESEDGEDEDEDDRHGDRHSRDA